jgi:glyoxylase-like metal-dependent hydrolase (beta-lactamase superfamily II)
MNGIDVGSLTVLPVFDGTARLKASMFTIDGGPADWSNHRHALNDDDTFVVPVGGFLVKTGARNVLLDAGIGSFNDEMFVGGELLNSLRAYGIGPEEIDTVIVSHLHSDHMGWLEKDGEATFGNADVWIGAADWQHFVVNATGSRRAERLTVVEPNVKLIDADNVTIAPGITTRQTPGHTPGHVSSVISSGGERLIVLGDALHCPTQLTETEWEFLYDTDPMKAKQTRAELIGEADDPKTQLLPCHFPDMAATRLIKAEGVKRWVMS